MMNSEGGVKDYRWCSGKLSIIILQADAQPILKDADLSSMSAKKVRQQIEEKLDIDLTERKKEVDDLVMECLKIKDGKGKDSKKKKNSKDDDEDEDEEEDEYEEEEEEDEEEEEKPKGKRGGAAAATPKKPPPKRQKKASSDEEGSEEDASDEEYSPKKGKGATPAKKGKAGGKKKKRGSDSDSGEDWAKTSRGSRGSSGAGGQGGPTPKKGGAKRSGGGYTRAYTLSPELASVVGQDSMARHEVVKKIWAIIKEKNLYLPLYLLAHHLDGLYDVISCPYICWLTILISEEHITF
uniref:DEK-C domain-containing protein n=1 Tax=Timema monikensis TaxID=170555 RepID=A0A7R9EHB6_9NEOP|nr:unnamed protein product [Timema monikensis]